FGGLAQAGIFNRVSGHMAGTQIGGVSFCDDHAYGLQAGVANFAKEAWGAQIGVANYADKVRGVQIGVVNIADELQGLQLGVVNKARNGMLLVFPVFNVGW